MQSHVVEVSGLYDMYLIQGVSSLHLLSPFQCPFYMIILCMCDRRPLPTYLCACTERERESKNMLRMTCVLADLSEQYHFPTSLACSDLRPDLVVYSQQTKATIIVELTVCYETNFEEARSRKEGKYIVS